ncbi:hypothetical protein ACWKSP_09305 [Micromonosporaceae bacterium Da 78-11]
MSIEVNLLRQAAKGIPRTFIRAQMCLDTHPLPLCTTATCQYD